MLILRGLLLLLFPILTLLPSPGVSHARHAPPLLSAAERALGAQAATAAYRDPNGAVRWLRRRSAVAHVDLGPDGKTIELQFKSGAAIIIVPPAPSTLPVSASFKTLTAERRARVRQPGIVSRTAVVLEPFATELGRGAAAGLAEANLLATAGFSVTTLQNQSVTVGVMAHLTDYSVVYMETHSGVLKNGDGVLVTGEADAHPYAALYQEHALIQAFVAGDPTRTLYNAVDAAFVLGHMGTFSPSSIAFLNGCSLLNAPLFWQALHTKNLGSLISWDSEVDDSVDEAAGQYVMNVLAAGSTVGNAVAAARVAGYGTSLVGDKIAQLGVLGSSEATLAQALDQQPTATPTSTSTATPTATPRTAVKKHARKCKRGHHRVHGKCKLIKKH